MRRPTPPVGVDVIKTFESFVDHLYICPAGYETIGWGHLVRPHERHLYVDRTITMAEGEELLQADLSDVRIGPEKGVARYITEELTDEQYAAIVSFTFNLGNGALQSSTLRKQINRGRHDDVPYQLSRWVFGGGKKLGGLVRRRAAEADIYMSG